MTSQLEDKPLQRAATDTIHGLLQASAERNPTAVAIGAPGRQPLSYGGLLRQVEETVTALLAAGLEPNDRVALVLQNGPEMAVAFLAVASGATCAPLNPAYTEDEFDFYISDLNARFLIVAAGMESPARQVAQRRQVPIIELQPRLEAEAGVFTLQTNCTWQIDQQPCFATSSDTALVLHTSGTTSKPKIVPLSQANVCSSAYNIATTLALGPSDCCLNVMPLFHIHGLIAAVLASLAAGARVICTPRFASEEFYTWLNEYAPTWYTAAPTIHQAVLANAATHRDIVASRPLRLIRSSSAALPEQILRDLEEAFQTQVIEAYGMTEASHQMASNPLAPRPRKPGSVGLPAGPEVAIMDEAGNLLPSGTIGEVVIRGTNVTQGYENNPQANQTAFSKGWFRTGDQGHFDSEGYLFLTGRLKEIINQGGEKIAPSEVDQVLAKHPAVAQAVAFALPHPTLGEAVAAAVVLKAGAQATERALRGFAATRLAEYKVPKQILIVDSIPKGATGKVQRIGLADKLADKLAARRETGYTAATTSIEIELADIWRRQLKAERVGLHDDFNMLGGDSLSMASMILQVEDQFKTTVPIEEFLKSPTLQNLARLVRPDDSSAHQETQPGQVPVVTDSLLGGLKNRLFQLLALYIPGNKTNRVWLHRMRGVKIGNNVSIGTSALIETAYPSLVSLGDNVTIGMRVVIIAHFRDSTVKSRILDQPTVRLENDVYIGPGVIILPNVTIGHGSVVSAGSVVTHSIPPKTLVQGNPAKPVARCGVSLAGGVPYEQFMRQLIPIKD